MEDRCPRRFAREEESLMGCRARPGGGV